MPLFRFSSASTDWIAVAIQRDAAVPSDLNDDCLVDELSHNSSRPRARSRDNDGASQTQALQDNCNGEKIIELELLTTRRTTWQL